MENVKITGQWRYNTDGIDLVSCKNAEIRNCFVRAFDDVIVLKGYSQFEGYTIHTVENILVEDCVLWCDWGRNLEIGAETSAPEYKNITFRNCDCIHLMHIALDIQVCDYAHIHDVVFEDIRVEYTKYDEECTYQETDDMEFVSKHGIPWLMYAGFSPISYCFCIERAKGLITDITFRNIQVFTDNEEEIPKTALRGFDEYSYIDNVKFQHITVNGKPFDMQRSLEITGPVANVTIEE
jgi:polygalacturonase